MTNLIDTPAGDTSSEPVKYGSSLKEELEEEEEEEVGHREEGGEETDSSRDEQEGEEGSEPESSSSGSTRTIRPVAANGGRSLENPAHCPDDLGPAAAAAAAAAAALHKKTQSSERDEQLILSVHELATLARRPGAANDHDDEEEEEDDCDLIEIDLSNRIEAAAAADQSPISHRTPTKCDTTRMLQPSKTRVSPNGGRVLATDDSDLDQEQDERFRSRQEHGSHAAAHAFSSNTSRSNHQAAPNHLVQPATTRPRTFAEAQPKLSFASRRMKEYFETFRGHGGRESAHLYQFFKAARTELAASLLFSLIVAQTLIVCRLHYKQQQITNGGPPPPPDSSHRAPVQLVAGLVAAAAVATLTQVFGHISGCHLAPAVSLALYFKGHISRARLASYLFAQAAGPLLAVLLLSLLTSSQVSLPAAHVGTSSLLANHQPPVGEAGNNRRLERTRRQTTADANSSTANEWAAAAAAGDEGSETLLMSILLAQEEELRRRRSPAANQQRGPTPSAPVMTPISGGGNDTNAATGSRQAPVNQGDAGTATSPPPPQVMIPEADTTTRPSTSSGPQLQPAGKHELRDGGWAERAAPSAGASPPPVDPGEAVPLAGPSGEGLATQATHAGDSSDPADDQQRRRQQRSGGQSDGALEQPPGADVNKTSTTTAPTPTAAAAAPASKLRRKKRQRQPQSQQTTNDGDHQQHEPSRSQQGPTQTERELPQQRLQLVNLLQFALPDEIMADDSVGQCASNRLGRRRPHNHPGPQQQQQHRPANDNELASGQPNRLDADISGGGQHHWWSCLSSSNGSQMFIFQLLATLLVVLAYLVNVDPRRVDLGYKSLSIGLAYCLAHTLTIQSGGFYANPWQVVWLAWFATNNDHDDGAPEWLGGGGGSPWRAEWSVYLLAPLVGGLFGALSHEYIDYTSLRNRGKQLHLRRSFYSLDNLQATASISGHVEQAAGASLQTQLQAAPPSQRRPPCCPSPLAQVAGFAGAAKSARGQELSPSALGAGAGGHLSGGGARAPPMGDQEAGHRTARPREGSVTVRVNPMLGQLGGQLGTLANRADHHQHHRRRCRQAAPAGNSVASTCSPTSSASESSSSTSLGSRSSSSVASYLRQLKLEQRRLNWGGNSAAYLECDADTRRPAQQLQQLCKQPATQTTAGSSSSSAPRTRRHPRDQYLDANFLISSAWPMGRRAGGGTAAAATSSRPENRANNNNGELHCLSVASRRDHQGGYLAAAAAGQCRKPTFSSSPSSSSPPPPAPQLSQFCTSQFM